MTPIPTQTSPSPADAREPAGASDPWHGWKPFGIFLGAGFLLVFLVEMVALVLALDDMQAGHERGGIWAILLMIFATMLAVGVIGGGLFVAIRRQGKREGEAERTREMEG